MMQAANRIAVAGATGRVGHHVVEVLRAQGHDVVPMSRSTGVDVISGAGLADALDGVTSSSTPPPDRRLTSRRPPRSSPQRRTTFMRLASAPGRTVLRRCRSSAPTASPRATVRPSRPTSALTVGRHPRTHPARVAVPRVRRAARGPGPGRRHQSRAADAHAARGSEKRRGGPRRDGRLPGQPFSGDSRISEIAGPREERLADMARLLITRRGDSVRIEDASNPDDPDRELNENGGLLPGPGATLAGLASKEWVDGALPERSGQGVERVGVGMVKGPSASAPSTTNVRAEPVCSSTTAIDTWLVRGLHSSLHVDPVAAARLELAGAGYVSVAVMSVSCSGRSPGTTAGRPARNSSAGLRIERLACGS